MDIRLFTEENKQWEKEHLAGFELDAELFERMGLRIVQIVPDRNSYRLETDKGFFSLKKLRFPIEEMDFARRCAVYLRDKGFCNVLGFIEQKSGGDYLEYQGERYYLTEWIDGRECDFQNVSDIKKGSELLADFHAKAKGFGYSKLPGSRNLLGKWPEAFKGRINEISNIKHMVECKEDRKPLDEAYISYAGRCMEDAERALELLMKSHYRNAVERSRKEGGFIHHDMLHNNLVYTFSGEVYIIDFEFFAVDIRMHDIAAFILRSLKRGEWDPDKARLVIDSYNSINPLKKGETDILLPFILFPHDFWGLTRQYLRQDKDFDEQEFIERINPESEGNERRRRCIDELLSKS